MPLSTSKIAFALVGCTLSSVALAAPKKPAARRVVSENELRAAQEMKRMFAAYEKFGNFTLTSDDVIRLGGSRYPLRSQSVGSFTRGGRVAVHTETSIQEPVFGKLQSAHLYDGKTCRYWRSDKKDSVISKADLNKHSDHLDNFFEPSIALDLIHAGMRRGPKGDLRKTYTSVHDKYKSKYIALPGGASRIELRGITVVNKVPMRRTLLITIGADGYMQRIEAKQSKVGSATLDLYDNASISKPRKLDEKTAFNWDLVKYPEPVVMGQTKDIPAVVPEKGQMPGVVVVE